MALGGVMAFDYESLKVETVEPLLAEFGKPATLHVNGETLDDPWDSDLDNDDTYPVTVVQTRFTKDTNQGTLVEKGDVLYLVSTQGAIVDPALADRINVDSAVYQVVRMDPLKPGTVTMLWKLHARK